MCRLLHLKPSHYRRFWPHFRKTRQLKQESSDRIPSHRPIWFVKLFRSSFATSIARQAYNFCCSSSCFERDLQLRLLVKFCGSSFATSAAPPKFLFKLYNFYCLSSLCGRALQLLLWFKFFQSGLLWPCVSAPVPRFSQRPLTHRQTFPCTSHCQLPRLLDPLELREPHWPDSSNLEGRSTPVAERSPYTKDLNIAKGSQLYDTDLLFMVAQTSQKNLCWQRSLTRVR